MLVLFFISRTGALPIFRLKRVDKLPDTFDFSTVIENITMPGNNTGRHCWVQHQNKKATVGLKEYISQKSPKSFEFVMAGYWHFVFEPFTKVVQWRYENLDDQKQGKKTDFFVLGTEDSGTVYELIDGGFKAEWGNGTICAVTKKPRTTTVELLCDFYAPKEGTLDTVSEIDMCHYLVRLRSRRVCHMPGVHNETEALITCVDDKTE